MSFLTAVVANAKGVQPTFRQDFTKSEVLDPRITFTRNSIATRFNSSGILETVTANQARFDYDILALQARGLLLEESRQNLLLQSVDLSTSAWTKLGSVVTSAGYTNDNGIVMANIFQSSGGYELSQPIVSTTGLTYTASISLRYVDTRWIRILIGDSAGVNASRVFVDVQNGVLGSIGNTGTGSGASATIEPQKNGVYRVTITGAATDTALRFFVIAANGNGNASRPAIANFLAANPQLEQGSYATSYIPTITTAVTRANDNVRITGSNLSSFYNQTEGTFVYEFSYDQSTTDTHFFNCYRGNSDFFSIRKQGNDLRLTVRKTGLPSADFSIMLNAIVGRYRVSFSYSDSGFYASVNAGNVFFGGANMLIVPTSIYLGSYTGAPSNIVNARYLAYYPKALPNDQLQKLSAL